MSTLSINVAGFIFLLYSSFQQCGNLDLQQFIVVSWLYTWILRWFSLSNKGREHMQKYYISNVTFSQLVTFMVPPVQYSISVRLPLSSSEATNLISVMWSGSRSHFTAPHFWKSWCGKESQTTSGWEGLVEVIWPHLQIIRVLL